MIAARYKSREIRIPFNAWSVRGINSGIKVCTSRNEAKGVPGDWFIVDNEKYELDEVFARRLGYVAEYLYRDEGACSPYEFVQVWNMIYGARAKRDVFDPEKIVYVHYFKKVR